MQVSFGSYEVGAVQRTPVPDITRLDTQQLASLTLACIEAKRAVASSRETTHAFDRPALLQIKGGDLSDCCSRWASKITEANRRLDENQRSIDDISFRFYGMNETDRATIERGRRKESAATEGVESEDADESETEGDGLGKRDLVADLISYFIGCVAGRWDMRLATGERRADTLGDPFDPLPVSSPATLQDQDGLPCRSSPKSYPLRVNWDGILPDDPDHPSDIVCRMREAFDLIWKDRAEAIEKEACELLVVGELRDYFRKPGKGGFWDDHVSRYSKSRRKAPIYWLLQSSKKNYALWLYYHWLDKDMLFKALLNYVEPKVRLEQSRLDTLRAQRSTLGDAARGAKKIAKDIERQEALLGEVKDFEEKLRRAANLDFGKNLDSSVIYDPDLNDGVVLTIAPLWELVPWKEAKGYWEELLAGKYEWSSMGKLLRKKGLVK
jgi:hypothetical protein